MSYSFMDDISSIVNYLYQPILFVFLTGNCYVPHCKEHSVVGHQHLIA